MTSVYPGQKSHIGINQKPMDPDIVLSASNYGANYWGKFEG
jgi:hypothetical protein